MRPDPGSTLLLTGADVAELVDLADCIVEVERAFRLHAKGAVAAPGLLGHAVRGGGFHVKAAGLPEPGACYAVKSNANFPANPQARGLPTIQGTITLFHGASGFPLAVMDSVEVTILRTAAATAVAARHLAREDAGSLTICGCGAQARSQIAALALVRPLARVFAVDRLACRAQRLADDVRRAGIEAHAVDDLAWALSRSDLCVTCTPSRKPLVRRGSVQPGTFVAAVGADDEDKRELEVELVASSALIVDLLEQCVRIGELHHALEAGAMTRGDVRAELGEVIAGLRPGRLAPEEVVVFDSTGTALQDVAVARLVYERAEARGTAARFEFRARHPSNGART